jgi:hypothetical protein
MDLVAVVSFRGNDAQKKQKIYFAATRALPGLGPRVLASAEYCPLSPLTSPSGSASVTPGQLRPFGIVTSRIHFRVLLPP